ncbi:MAG: SET domain-containing protein [Ferruginibacter sp.]
MALLEKQLEVKPSTLPASGKGLFTNQPIPKGTRIVEYKGKITTWTAADHDNGNNAYIYYISRNHVIDASKYLSSVARYANDAAGLSRVKGINNNSQYVMEGKKIFIESTKSIPAGAEIFVAYGKDYWDVIKKNKVLG